MSLLIRFSAEAASELNDVAASYDERQPGLGEAFIDAVETALGLVADWPGSGAKVPGLAETSVSGGSRWLDSHTTSRTSSSMTTSVSSRSHMTAAGRAIGHPKPATRAPVVHRTPARWSHAPIRRAVAAGKAASVSGFVQHAVSVSLDDVAGWGALLAEAPSRTGGDLTDDERAWADRILGTDEATKPSAA